MDQPRSYGLGWGKNCCPLLRFRRRAAVSFLIPHRRQRSCATAARAHVSRSQKKARAADSPAIITLSQVPFLRRKNLCGS